MVKTKNGIKQIVALVLIVALAVASLLLAIPKNSKSVYAAPAMSSYTGGLYRAGEYLPTWKDESKDTDSVLTKTYDQLIADGDITVSGHNITINNKDLEGDLVIVVYGLSPDLSGMFEGCSKLTTIIIEDTDGSDEFTNLSRMFYGCSSLKQVMLTNDGWTIPSSAVTTDMFTGCSSLEKMSIRNISGKTFADLGLKFESYSSQYGTYTEADEIDGNTDITLSGYKGSTTPTTPSTGVATDTLGLVVTAVIVLAICYVASKKKKVQR